MVDAVRSRDQEKERLSRALNHLPNPGNVVMIIIEKNEAVDE
jgi:hypothetical protein